MENQHPNPFVDEDDMIENELMDSQVTESNGLNPEISISGPDVVPEITEVNYDRVAARLLQDNFVLTALEFHTELVESGREIPRLRDFFSNPANFERTRVNESSPPGLPRTSSVQTFDSLDFARYSDDGDRQENDKVAVLEFELRKAQDTIKSLRASLTKTAETELSSPDAPTDSAEHFAEDEPVRAYEKRALNFLVNEYLLVNDYKLSSVTFAEENDNQDFEDWDDVGLNIAKPPDILHLYRDYGQHTTHVIATQDASCMTDEAGKQEEEEEEESGDDAELHTQELLKQISVLEDQIRALSSENDFLAHQLSSMEREAQAVHKLKTRSSTPAVSPISTPSKLTDSQPKHVDTAAVEHIHHGNSLETDKCDDIGVTPLSGDNDPTMCNGEHVNEFSNVESHQTDSSSTQAGDTMQGQYETCDSVLAEQGTENPSQDVTSAINRTPDVLMSSDETDSHHPSAPTPHSQLPTCNRKMTESFRKTLIETAFQVPQDNRIVAEVCQPWSDETEQQVVLMLARCLPHIVPNVLLAKREELIPLIICTAALHRDAKQRDTLLNILFNLIKRPDHEQRHMILTGCVAFAQHVGTSRVESELLPQCWEQIGHKYCERRQLVAEACGALAPYLSSELRGSLVLSMLQQMMCEERDEGVRGAITRSLGLLAGFIDDPDKYPLASQLMLSALVDSSERVVTAVQHVFLPALAMWASELEKLESHLVQLLFDKLKDLVPKSGPDSEMSGPGGQPTDKLRFCLYIQTLQQLVPMLFASVISQGPYMSKLSSVSPQDTIMLTSRFPTPPSSLMDLSVILGSPQHLAAILYLYEEHISAEWYQPWEAFNWLAGHLVPEMISLLNQLDVTSSSTIHAMADFARSLCRMFGRTFTLSKVTPKFQAVLSIPDECIDAKILSGKTALTKFTVPVYAAGILGAFATEEDMAVLTSFLQDLMCTLSLCQAPLDSLKAAFVELCQEEKFHELLLSVLWDGVVHTSANIRSSAGKMFELLVSNVEESLVSTRIVPALVTLASDPEISVRIATIPAFGTILETVTERSILDKVHLQLQSFMDDPLYRDQHALHIEFIRTLARVGPNTEPKFRDEFVLPRLAILANNNNNLNNDTRKHDVALQLFEAYSALSCCFISDQLIQEAMLPGLCCLHSDLVKVAPDHVDVVASMIKELEDKVDSGKNGSHVGASHLTPGGPDDMKAKMLSRFKDVRDRASTSKTNFSKIFGSGKK